MSARSSRRHLSLILAVALVAASAGLVSAQRTQPVPRMTLPEVTQQERERTDDPQFRSGVTRVEVSVLVLDRNGAPVHGLTAADFELLENGVPQVVRSFTPFTYEPHALVLPEPVLGRDRPAPPLSMPASNYYASASRVFALVLDDLHVDARRTRVARAAARRLVEQLTPADLLFVTMTSSSESTGYFTRDRRHALEMIDRFTGQRLLDKTIGGRRFPGHDFEAERLDHYERLCATIRNVSLALRDVSGRRKTVILVSEGSSFGAGLSDMTVKMPTPTSGGRANVPTGASRVMNDALAAAAAGNVAIYPLSPAGLDVADADVIQVQGLINPEMNAAVYSDILTEARQAKEMSRDLAALTGGVSLVDTNDALAGIDRVVSDASSHYILTYEPEKPPKGSEYRRIEVKVHRPDVRVLARRGYSAPGTRPVPPMKVPTTLPPQLRSLLSGVMPDDGLPMRVQAVPVSRKGEIATIAVIVEVNGSVLARTGHKSWARRATHGAHVMDIACGLNLDEVCSCSPRIIGVQLPSEVTADPSSGKLEYYAALGVIYILLRADHVAAQYGIAPLPVVVNLSYGVHHGPHDGNSLFEQMLDALTLARRALGPFTLVLPAGNSHLARCHARFELAPMTTHPGMQWRVQPDDATQTLLEIWLPYNAGASQIEVAEIETPGGTKLGPLKAGDPPLLWPPTTRPVLRMAYPAVPAFGKRNVISLWLAPTVATLEPATPPVVPTVPPVAPSGTWRITVKNVGTTSLSIDSWIWRDSAPFGFPVRGRQSRFDDPEYIRFDPQGRDLEEDMGSSYVTRDRSINGIATGRETVAIGGCRRSDLASARYSAGGPTLQPSSLQPPPRTGPDATATSEWSVACHGMLAAGTRSRSVVAVNGTSVAAPQVTRWIANRMAGGYSGKGAEVIVEGNNHPTPKITEKRGKYGQVRPGYSTIRVDRSAPL